MIRKLTINDDTGDFELNNQPIGNYIEIQRLEDNLIITHSLEHGKPELISFPGVSEYAIPFGHNRVSTVYVEELKIYVFQVNRPQWFPGVARHNTDC